jgi:hypothetical protein
MKFVAKTPKTPQRTPKCDIPMRIWVVTDMANIRLAKRGAIMKVRDLLSGKAMFGYTVVNTAQSSWPLETKYTVVRTSFALPNKSISIEIVRQ